MPRTRSRLERQEINEVGTPGAEQHTGHAGAAAVVTDTLREVTEGISEALATSEPVYGPGGDAEALGGLHRLTQVPDWVPLAVDTETNALYEDDGARVSTVSVAWVDPEILLGGPERLDHAIQTGEGVHSVALPFSQGKWLGRHRYKSEYGGGDVYESDLRNPNLGPWEWRSLFEALRRHQLVFHNGKFDLAKLRFAPLGGTGTGVELLDNWLWDTQVCAPEVWPGHTSSLKPTAARLWGENETAEAEALKPHLGPKTDPRYDLVPWEVIKPYAAKDAELTIRLFYAQMRVTVGWEDEPWAYDGTLLAQCRREIAVAKVLYRMERAGVPYDAKESLRIGERLQVRKLELENGLPFRPTDPAAKKWLFEADELGNSRAKPLAQTQTGAPSLTADVVLQLIGKYPEGTEVGDAMRAWGQRNKITTALKMWYLPYATGVGRDGRLRTCFRQVTRGRGDADGGTRSGRFSVERVNLQAIPHDYRLQLGDNSGSAEEVFTPRQLIGRAAQFDGWELWEFDLAQAELRVAAAWAWCTPMLDALKHGRDLHSETTTELFGVAQSDPDFGHYRQIGKRSNFAQPYDEPVATPQGWSTIGELEVGSQVVGRDGRPQTVEAIPFDDLAEVWQVRLESGIVVRCSENHLWQVYDRSGTCRIVTTAGLAAMTGTRTLPVCDPVVYPAKDLPVDPYVLGVLLGDGAWRTTPCFTILTTDHEIAQEVERRLPPGDRLVATVYPSRPNMTRYSIHGGGVMQGLRDLGLSLGYKRPVAGAAKFVPPVYLLGSVQQRLDLLRGLMDTDGSAGKAGTGNKGLVGATYRFVGASRSLVVAVVELMRSLGGVGTYRQRGEYHLASVRGPVCPFWLPRKAARWRPAKRRRLRVMSVERTGQVVPQRCIKVSNPDELYLTRDYVVTHNTLCFGAGGDTLARMVLKETGQVMSRYQAQTIVRDWNELYPQYRQTIRLWQDYADRVGSVPLASRAGFASGRRRRFTEGEETHKAFNQLVQASLAEFLKDWLLAAQDICDAAGLGEEPGVGWTGLLICIHDSIVVLLPAGGRGETIAEAIKRAAHDLWQGYFNTPDLWGRVAMVDGYAEAKRW